MLCLLTHRHVPLCAAAGKARVEAAAASKARKAFEAKELSASNSALNGRIRRQGPVTDADLTDDGKRPALHMMARSPRALRLRAEATYPRSPTIALAAARSSFAAPEVLSSSHRVCLIARALAAAYAHGLKLAAESKARKAAEASELAAHAARTAERNRQQLTRSDDDIMDEAAGQRRVELKVLGRQQRVAARKALRDSNAEMLRRVRGCVYHRTRRLRVCYCCCCCSRSPARSRLHVRYTACTALLPPVSAQRVSYTPHAALVIASP